MNLRTVGQLRSYLEKNGISPEHLGKEIKVSNMTLRRILKRHPSMKIPERYHAQLDAHVGVASPAPQVNLSNAQYDFKALISELEANGSAVSDTKQLEANLEEKLTDQGIGKTFKSQIGYIRQALTSAKVTKANRALAIGALLYFINPFDLIPDTALGIGYLDDFAVLSMVSAILAKGEK